jgi:hypothetical protein
MKKNYSDFAKNNFWFYKTLKRENPNTMEVFESVKKFGDIFEELEIEEDLKTENEKNR